MEALFLRILNMSITGAYVIVAVILIRLLLIRMPKRYAYWLWSVVLFRLVCPVSLSSVFSMFRAKPFNMTIAQSEGTAMLRYIPENIGYMQSPEITVGIPMMNSVISGSLPDAAPYASVNPMQVWIFVGTIIWTVGLVLFLAYNFYTYIALKRRMDTAVRFEGNIYESDRIRSPFLLGIIRPRIYIPFGMGDAERAHILAHERVHLKRMDHIIKMFGFFVMVLHWFNPLVWLAYSLMAKDMEMSCDEYVLIGADDNKAKDYSTALVSFAANRRFLVASPLAFGETGVRERVKNVLRNRKLPRWAAVAILLVCAITVVACATNPLGTPNTNQAEFYGNYRFEKPIYMTPISSFLPMEGMKEYYTLTENTYVQVDEHGQRQRVSVTWEQMKWDTTKFQEAFMMADFGVPDITRYRNKSVYKLKDASGSSIYHLYKMDDDIWLARVGKNAEQQESFWSIYQISPVEGTVPDKMSVSGWTEGVEAFQAIQGEYTSSYDNDTCYNITPDYVRNNSKFQIFKYSVSCATFLLYDGEIYPLGAYFGGFGVVSLAMADLNTDGMQELYFTSSWGSGLHRSNAAYFDPATKEIVPFSYAHLNEDMMFAYSPAGGLSLHEADVTEITDFAHYNVVKKEFLADVVEVDGKMDAPVKITDP